FGEAGYHIAKSLVQKEGVSLLAYDPKALLPEGEYIRQRAAETNVTLTPELSTLFETSDVILSLVSASAVISLASQSVQWIKPGQIYADMNSAGPDTKIQAAAIVDRSGARFVDA